jgi:putative oxidoreductase
MTTATAPLSVRPQTTGRALRAALWSVQGLLAAAFLASGAMKLAQPIEVLAQQASYAAALPAVVVRFIGLAEVAGALGLILPAVTRIKPGLTPLAAGGLVVVMVLAMIWHLTHGEAAFVAAPLVLGALAAFVAWGRHLRAPIAPRA